MLDLDVIDNPATAVVALDPMRAEILNALAAPGSATTVAASLGLPRQKVNYHLRQLEEHGLVLLVEERQRRGLVERVVAASARSYVVSVKALGGTAADPSRTDRLSTRYLIAVAARMVHEVAALARRADAAGKPLATLAIDTEVRFASASQRAAFTAELATAVTQVVARYHDEGAANGRWHRLIIAAHPRAEPDPTTHDSNREVTQ